jgi:hypothetical protein
MERADFRLREKGLSVQAERLSVLWEGCHITPLQQAFTRIEKLLEAGDALSDALILEVREILSTSEWKVFLTLRGAGSAFTAGSRVEECHAGTTKATAVIDRMRKRLQPLGLGIESARQARTKGTQVPPGAKGYRLLMDGHAL